jgi:cobalamin-dependent methionine synthase I
MRGSVSAAVFVATAGPKFEAWSKRLIEEGELVLGYMVDAAASEAAERAMDLIQEHFAGWIKERGLRVTNRFSPGYCGWPVSDQHALFSLLPERFCGVALTPSSLMVPIKSVSGLIGIGPGVRFHPYPCRWCELKNCYKRRTR